jgi:zinc transport system substrate-binding protein
MKRFKCLFAAVAASIALGAASTAATAEMKVVVTIKPIHSLVIRLMEGIGTPALLIEGAASPHAFSLKPSDVRRVNAADVFIRVSEGLEPFTGKIVKALPESVQLVTLEETPGLELLELRRSGTFEPHRDDVGGASHVTHAGEVHEEGMRHSVKDGHIWLDPDNAKAIVTHLARVLSARAPADADKLKENARRLNAEIDALAATIEAETKPLKDKPFVVFHDAYQYFEKRFGLDAVGSITVGPEVQPSAKRLAELRRKIRTLKAVCVFAEPLFQPNLVAAVSEGTNARAGTLDPEGMTLAPGAGLYFELMRNLAAGLKSCLEQPS